MSVLAIIKDNYLTSDVIPDQRKFVIIGLPRDNDYECDNDWCAAILSDGTIVGNSKSFSREAVRVLSSAKDLKTVSQTEVEILSGRTDLDSAVYAGYISDYGLHPHQLVEITDNMDIPPDLTLEYIKAVNSQRANNNYRIAFIKDDKYAEGLLISCGLLGENGNSGSGEIIINSVTNNRLVCQYCGLGWITDHTAKWSKLQRSIATALGVLKAHFTCGLRFNRLYRESVNRVLMTMQHEAETGLAKVLLKRNHLTTAIDAVSYESTKSVSTPINIQLFPSITRDLLVISHMRQALNTLIFWGSEEHLLSDDDIYNIEQLVENLQSDRTNNLTNQALRRVEACKSMNRIVRGDRQVYMGPDQQQIPFNLQRSEHLYWAWSNVEYKQIRSVNVSTSRRVRAGTAPGVNSRGSTTTEFERTDYNQNQTEMLGKGFVGISDKAMYFSSSAGRSVRVGFDHLVSASRIENGLSFQENYVQGDRQWPKQFIGLDGWEAHMVLRSVTRRPEELSVDWSRFSSKAMTNTDATGSRHRSNFSENLLHSFKEGYKRGQSRDQTRGTSNVRCPSCSSIIVARQSTSSAEYVCRACGNSWSLG